MPILRFLLAAAALFLAHGKIYAAGSGLDMMSLPETVQEIIALSGKQTPNLLYVGTATYDAKDAQETQTKSFAAAGCAVSSLAVAVSSPPMDVMRAMFAGADVVLVSGGNTLYARDRWVATGVDKLMAEALSNGTVMCGGSAGGIVWFDGGHSDSMEPASYKNPPGPLLNPNMSDEEMNNWAYIRVPGLGFLHSLFCPHYDVTEGNGVARSTDFTTLLQMHSGENGIGVDNWAALVIDGDKYTVISRKGKPGSVDPSGKFTPNQGGRPGAWRMQISSSGFLQRSLIPTTGRASDLFVAPRYVVESSMLSVARKQNPDDGKPPAQRSAALLEL